MKPIALFAALTAVVSLAHAADEPKPFAGLLAKDTPVRGEIGMVQPPKEIEKYIAKVEQAARKDVAWFQEYSKTNRNGAPLPYHEKLGLTKEEYDEYLKLWQKREFKAMQPVMLQLRESAGSWSISATGAAGALTTLRYDAKQDIFKSANGNLKRIDDIQANAESILGAWNGQEWKYEEETGLGKTKENFAIGKFADKPFGLIVYRAQEVSSQGTLLLDKSLVVRFPLGAKASATPASAPAPVKPKKS